MTGSEWKVLKSELVMTHPNIEVALEQVSLPDGTIIDDWPIVNAHDYVNVAEFNEVGEALILEGYKHGARRSGWQVVGGYIEQGEDPLTAAQRELLEETGHEAENWRYLGSFVIDANRHVGVGHFFLCTNAHAVRQPDSGDLEETRLRWVSLKDLRYALMDGRISIISYAMNITLALLALNKLSQNQALSYLLANASNGNGA
jgi:8-oxo-dGTP pyrophosphatase MutT (NUDIX family)